MVTLSKQGRVTPRAIFSAIFCLIGSLTFAQTTYYARQNGNWATASTWSTVSCSGAAAATIPGSTSNVVICAGRTVTASSNTNTTVANVTIDATGILTRSGNGHIYMNSLVLNGLVNGNGQGDLRIGNTAGSTLSGTGIYSVDNGNSDIRLQSNVTILAGTDLTFDDDGTFRINGKTATNNGKISIITPSNFSGNGTFTNATTTSYLLYSRASDFGGTTLNASGAGNTVEFKPTSGSRRVNSSGGIFHHLIINGTTSRLRAATTIRGNLTINTGAILDVNGFDINIAGNWTNSGSFSEGTRTVTFNGSANNQTVTAETFYNLTINNTFAGGKVTATGNILITANRTLTMTSGIFDMQTNTLSQTSGSAKLTASGGDLRMAKTGVTLPELTGTYTITGGTITFSGSGAQTARALNTAPSTYYYHIAFSGGGTTTLAGDITVRGNWTNTGNTVTGNVTTNFAGTGTQTITNTAGQSFYRVNVNTTGPLTLAASTNATVTNTLTMTKGNVNLNGQTLRLGNAAGATLVHTLATATCYGGIFQRYFPSGTAISPTAAPLYGLFPIGSSTNYRPVQITSTANATTGGYVGFQHNDALTTTDVNYVDNEGVTIQRITDMNDEGSIVGLVGGTYTLSMTLNGLSSQGVITDLKLEIQDTPPFGVGTTVASTGTPAAPTATRSGLASTDLAHIFVLGTKNASATPMVASYYSRKSSTWTDVTAGNSTWSLTNGGPSCNCVPISSSIVYITTGTTVTITTGAQTVDFLKIKTGGILNSTSGSLTVNYDMSTELTGKFGAGGSTAWTIKRDLLLSGTGASTSTVALTITGDLQIDAGTSLATTAALSVAGDEITIDGTLGIGSSTLTLSGTDASISGSAGAAAINGTSSANISITTSKSIVSGSNLTIQPNINLSSGAVLTNLGTVTHSGNLTGAAASSTWVNDANSVYNVTGAVLATGALNTDAIPNLVNYNGSGAQTVKAPSTTYYDLQISNAGTKSLTGNITVDNSLTIQDAAILDASTFTLDGGGDLNMTGTSQLLIGKTTTGTYPEMTGGYNLDGGTITFKQAGTGTYSALAVDYYNLTLSGSSSGTFDFPSGGNVVNNLSVTLSGTSKMTVAADLVVGNTFTFNSPSSNTSTLDANVTVGTFTMAGGILSTTGTFVFEINDGDWTYNTGATFTEATTTSVLFSSINDQNIGGTKATSLTNLELNNSGPTGVVLAKGLNLSGVLTLTGGNLVSSSANMLVMAAGSSVLTPSNDSYVDGPMQKIGSTDFTFPVGKDGEYRPIAITGVTTVNPTFQAEYFHSDPGVSYNLASKDVTLIRMQTSEYWILAPTVVGPQAFVWLSWDDFSGIVNDLTSIRVARWDGATWKDHGNGGTTGNVTPATGTVRSAAIVTSFSPFTLASGNGNNPLPVELLSFTAKLDGTQVLLDWNTASELDNDYFTIDKTKDTRKFAEIARVKGAGTTNMASVYSTIDKTPYTGVSYYRLRQTDFEGRVTDMGMVAVNNSGGTETQALIVFPNPAHSVPFNVNLRGYGSGEQVALDLRDAKGQTMLSKALVAENTGELIYAVDTSTLSPGVYVLTVRGGLGPISVKVVIQ